VLARGTVGVRFVNQREVDINVGFNEVNGNPVCHVASRGVGHDELQAPAIRIQAQIDGGARVELNACTSHLWPGSS